MNTRFYLIAMLIFFLGSSNLLRAQEDAQEGEVPENPWKKGVGIGLDFSQLIQLNPKQGAGQNKIGIGGALNFFANYANKRVAWDNTASWQFGLLKLGAGILPVPGNEKVPFQKAIDELRLRSKWGYKTSEDSKLFYTADFSFLSQLTATYPGPAEYPGNFLENIADTITNAKFFSPATITLSIGIDFKPLDKISIYYSPLGTKFIIVANDEIAVLGVHGNPVVRDANGNVISFENTDSQLGSLLKINFTDKLWEDRASFSSTMALFSNYLNNPENIDLDWTSELGLNLFKGFQLSLLVNIFYDDDVLVQITDRQAPNGINGLGKRVSLTEQLLLKYNVEF